jgi:ribosome biogenesis GTPase
MSPVLGLVIRGSRNIFTVRNEDGAEFECRIKGKVLRGVEGFYNPLAPGDRVRFESAGDGAGLIEGFEERRNLLTRFNQKGQAPQLLAANVDQILCVTTPASPPFRPRFLDRVLVQAEIAGIEPVILCNKQDLSVDDPDVEERLEDFNRIGYRVLRLSAKTGEGMDELRRLLKGRLSVMLGQSGVGKSSLINALAPGQNIPVGAINEKYDRGNHTTTISLMVNLGAPAGNSGTAIIDTPGIRRFAPHGIGAGDLICYMREFAELAGKCVYGLSCSHVREPGCKVMEAVHAGVIHEDRYKSYLRIRNELQDPFRE